MDCEAGSAPAPPPRNEAVHDYAPGSLERRALQAELKSMLSERIPAPLVINGARIETGEIMNAVCPHDHEHVLAHVHQGGAAEAEQGIAAALAVHPEWSRLDWRARASVFLKAADLLSGPWRARLNAATMLGQSKTVHQAEIDAAAELADFWRFNVHFMERLYQEQPLSPAGVWNRSDYRPLEGFVYAVTPFNFTAIAGNLPTAPALMGNTVLWKPSPHAMLSAHYVMALLEEAGLPPGVINLVYGDAEEISEVALSDESLAGVHFTGSTIVYDAIRRKVETRQYKNYPRLVGETGGKNFILVHESADLDAATTAVIRGAYEYQGQKCSAASRIFAPRSLWPQLKQRLVDEIGTIPMGDVADFRNFMGAVIGAAAWARHDAALKAAFPGCEQAADAFPLSTLLAVHDADYIAFLQNAHQEWIADGRDGDAFPMVWPVHGMRGDKTPQTIVGKASRYSFEVSTGIMEHSWLSARRSAETALSGASALVRGERAAFSLCRPPGHHAGRDYFGGYCFLNNAGVAAQYLREAGAARIAVLDVDHHHGNGTQQIFYDRSDVFYLSIHADPDTDFPYFLGFADETGCGPGEGFNLNMPLARGAGWSVYEPALFHCLKAVKAYAPDALVVSLGVDTAAGDLLSGFLLRPDDFRRLGAAVAGLGLKTLFVFEGGYAVDDIGGHVVNVLDGFCDR